MIAPTAVALDGVTATGLPVVLGLALFAVVLFATLQWRSRRAAERTADAQRKMRYAEHERFVAQWDKRSQMPDWHWDLDPRYEEIRRSRRID